MNLLYNNKRNLLIVIYLIIQIAYLITEYSITEHQFGVPLDDGWIHFRFAENIAAGKFFQYNIGELTPGTTSPLWSVMMSIPFLFSKDIVLTFALLLSSIFFLTALLELYKLGLKMGFNLQNSMFLVLLTMFSGRLLWSSLSGMETTFFVLLCVLVLKNHIKEIEQTKLLISTGFLLGIAGTIRPEAYLFTAIYYFTSVILFWKKFRENIYPFLGSVAVLAVVVLPYILLSYYVTNSLFPNKYQQLGDIAYLPDIQYLIRAGRLFISDNLIIVILWFTAMAYFILQLFMRKVDKKLLLVNLWVILFPAVSSVISPVTHHHGRYLIPLIPFINIVSVNLFQVLYGYLSKKGLWRSSLLQKLSIVIILAFSFNSAVIFAGKLGWNVENINNQHVKIGKWLNDNLPDEKAFGMNDIGAIVYITNRYVVDMAGLVTPEIFAYMKLNPHERTISLLKLLKDKEVNYIIIYPGWFTYLMDNYKSYLTTVYSARLERNTICGGDEMFVYKINWEKLPLE